MPEPRSRREQVARGGPAPSGLPPFKAQPVGPPPTPNFTRSLRVFGERGVALDVNSPLTRQDSRFAALFADAGWPSYWLTYIYPAKGRIGWRLVIAGRADILVGDDYGRILTYAAFSGYYLDLPPEPRPTPLRQRVFELLVAPRVPAEVPALFTNLDSDTRALAVWPNLRSL